MKKCKVNTSVRATLLVGFLISGNSAVWAQSVDEHAGHEMTAAPMHMDHGEMGQSDASQAMDHGEMDHGEMDHGEMDHGEMDHGEMDHGEMDQSDASQTMDHGAMKMQGGKAPADARDPHAYSGGFTLTEGPYVLPVPWRLKLADEHHFVSLLGDRFEYNNDADATVYDLQGWYGSTFDRAVIKAEGDISKGRLEESQTELLWGHALTAYWDTQLGIRFDQYDEGDTRQWLAVGVQGLAPYWFELDLTAYLGTAGRTALSAEAEYEILLTQRWILQSRAELTANGKDDEANGVGRGLSTLEGGLRLRYEFSRQFAPYIGVEWSGKFGNTADYAQASGESRNDTSLVAGVRFWF